MLTLDNPLLYATFLEVALYGCYVVAFVTYIKRREECPRRTFVKPLSILFVLCGAFVFLGVVHQCKVLAHPTGVLAGISSEDIETIKALLSILINLITKCALIYRCHMWWGSSAVLGIPIVLAIFHYGMSVVYVVATCIGSTKYFPAWVLVNGQTGSMVAYEADLIIFLLLLYKIKGMRLKREAALTTVHASSSRNTLFVWSDTTILILIMYACVMVSFKEGSNFMPTLGRGLITITYGLTTTLIFLRVLEDEILFSRAQRDLERPVFQDSEVTTKAMQDD